MKRTFLLAFLVLVSLLFGCAKKEARPPEAAEYPAAAQGAEDEAEPAAAQAENMEKAEEEPPAPVYDETPARSDMALTADGRGASRVYEKDGVLLVTMRDFAAMMDGSYEADDTQGTVIFGERTAQAGKDGAYLQPTGAKIAGGEQVLYDGADWFVPARDLLMLTGRTEFLDAEEQHLYYTTLPDKAEIAEGLSIPILMYHAVSDEMWGYWDLFVSPKDLEAQLQYMHDNGYTTITFEDLPHVTAQDKPVMLTFDDGYRDNYTELFPILQKFGAKATIFCITGSIGGEHSLTGEQIKEMSDSGLVSIQSHTVTHPYLGSSDAETVARECEQSRLDLVRITGKLPFVLCYPSGSVSESAIETIGKSYDFGVRMDGGLYVTGTDAYHVPRFYVKRGMGAGDISYYLNVG